MFEWTPTTIALVVAGVIVLILIVVLIARNSRKQREERELQDQRRAEELRREAERDRVALREEEIEVHEQELAAERARVKAEKASMEADRLEHEAEDRRGGIQAAHGDIDNRLEEADELAPRDRSAGRVDGERQAGPVRHEPREEHGRDRVDERHFEGQGVEDGSGDQRQVRRNRDVDHADTHPDDGDRI